MDPVPHLHWPSEGGVGVFVIVPGLGIPADYYSKFARALVDAGYHCLVQELRGHGISPLKPGRETDFGYADLADDLDSLVTLAGKRHPDLPVYLLGHSLGGQLALMHAVRLPGKVQRLLLVASGSPYFGNYRGWTRWTIRLAPLIFRTMGWVLGNVRGRWVGFGGIEARSVMADWSTLALRNRIDPVGDSFDYERSFETLSIPIDMFSFDRDDLAPETAARGLIARCPSADRAFRMIGSDEVGFKAGHFNWAHHSDVLLPLFLERFPKR